MGAPTPRAPQPPSVEAQEHACRLPAPAFRYAASVLLNLDAGELDDEPRELAALAHVLHIACGGHAGDATSMAATLARAHASGARVGAHPSYPDRAGFGRRALSLPLDDLRASLMHQVTELARHAAAQGLRLTSLKPHGALYHAADGDEALAQLLGDVASKATGAPLALVGPPGGYLQSTAIAFGLGYLREGFADRRYESDGTLRARTLPGALLETVDAAVAQAKALAASGRYDTLCIHGDSPLAVPMLQALREVFP